MANRTRRVATRLFISVSLAQVLVGGLIAGFITSYFYIPVRTQGEQLLSTLSKFPTSASTRAKLAQTYLDLNNLRMAQNEINFQGDTLGASTEFTNLEDKITTKVTNDKNLEEYWLKIANEYPNYRDAWVQLLCLAKNRGDLISTKRYEDKILSLDPNFPLTSLIH